MAECTVELTTSEINSLLGNTAKLFERIKSISSKVEAGFERRDFFDFDYKKLGANYASICLDIEEMHELVAELNSIIHAAMRGGGKTD